MDPASLVLPPLNCALAPILGDYYQDFSPAIDLVRSGYHGSIDERGVPLLNVPGQGEFANAVTTAQYALANMTALRRGEDRAAAIALAQLEWLVENQEQEGDLAGCWVMRHDNQKYRWLRAPWTGSLASGHAISALLRGHEMFAREEFRCAAVAAYRALHEERGRWTLFTEDGEDLWYEEYPDDVPLHVLNGHIYTLLAVLDHARVTGDRTAADRWERGWRTVRRHLEEFDTGYWSVYDLRFRELTNIHYHKNIHIPILRILASLCADSYFADVADRWERFLISRSARARQAIALRVRARLRR